MNRTDKKTWTAQLVALIEYFHAETRMKYTVIGDRSIKNPRMWQRLQAGGTITLEKAEQVVSWMAGQGFYLTLEGEPYVQEIDPTRGKVSRGEEGIQNRQ